MQASIIIVANWDVFIEFAESIKYSLTEMGFDKVNIIDEADWKPPYRHYSLNIVIKAFRPFAFTTLNGYRILFQTEECWNDRERGSYRFKLSHGYDRVLEMYDENCKLLGTEKVVYCPVGYSPAWERDLPEVEEDVDVFFHGSLTDRRKEFISSLESEGYNVVASSNHYGKTRDEMIARSKITMNIKAYDKWSYGPMHCLPAQANKQFLMAEKANGGHGPFVPNKHFVEYDGLEDCKKKVKKWLDAGHGARKAFAENAYNEMVKDCDFTEILKSALESKKGGVNLL
jgi:hypothetical protein